MIRLLVWLVERLLYRPQPGARSAARTYPGGGRMNPHVDVELDSGCGVWVRRVGD